MHRSGTSLLTNLLNVLGVDLGTDLLAPSVINETGFWENESIYRTQDALMNHIAKDWGEHGFAYPFAIDWQRLPEFRTFQDQLVSIVRAEMAGAKGIWGFKDPRTCRLLPMWKKIFAELDLEPLYVLAVRNPSVVVESLLKIYPLDPLHAELVWLLYNLDAVREAGKDLRIVVDYDRWFTAPREQAQAVAKALELKWPDDESDLVDRLTQTIRPDLRHAEARRPCSRPFVTKIHQALQNAAATGCAPDEIISGDLKRADECLAAALELLRGALKENEKTKRDAAEKAPSPTKEDLKRPKSPQGLRLLAKAFFVEQDWAQAGLLFQSLVHHFPDDIEIWQARLECARRQGHRTLARLILQDALRLHPAWSAVFGANHPPAAQAA